MINGTIYKITNPKGKVYIGQTIRPVHVRWDEYKSLQCVSQHKIYNSLVKYGAHEHRFEVVETGIKTHEELDEKEIFYIAKYNSFYKGLNCTKGGQGVVKESKQEKHDRYIKNYNASNASRMKKQMMLWENPHIYESEEEVPKYLVSAYREGLFREAHGGMSSFDYSQIQSKCVTKAKLYRAEQHRNDAPIQRINRAEYLKAIGNDEVALTYITLIEFLTVEPLSEYQISKLTGINSSIVRACLNGLGKVIVGKDGSNTTYAVKGNIRFV